MKVANIEQAIVAVAGNGGDIATLSKLAETLLVGDNYIAARGRLATVMATLTTKTAPKTEPVVQATLVDVDAPKTAPKKAARKAKVVKFTTHPIVREIDHVKCPCNNANDNPCGAKVLGNGFCPGHGGKVDPNAPQQAKMRVK